MKRNASYHAKTQRRKEFRFPALLMDSPLERLSFSFLCGFATLREALFSLVPTLCVGTRVPTLCVA
jgi:hypothetical protein